MKIRLLLAIAAITVAQGCATYNPMDAAKGAWEQGAGAPEDATEKETNCAKWAKDPDFWKKTAKGGGIGGLVGAGYSLLKGDFKASTTAVTAAIGATTAAAISGSEYTENKKKCLANYAKWEKQNAAEPDSEKTSSEGREESTLERR